jgi:hypothetical protein
MEQPSQTVPGPTFGRPDKPLGRGLEDVARVFLSGNAVEKSFERRAVPQATRPLPQDVAARNTPSCYGRLRLLGSSWRRH